MGLGFRERRAIKGLIAFLIAVGANAVALAQDNVVVQWNNAALQTIRYRRSSPTINARALAITHTCMYDAWAAYDNKALATILGGQLRRPQAERTEQNKITAIPWGTDRKGSDRRQSWIQP